MGLLDKIKGFVNSKIEEEKQRQEEKRKEEEKRREEEKQRQEEEKRKREVANRFNPDGKSLEWFSSEDGLKTYCEYIKAQNYILEENIKKEKEKKYPDYDFDLVVKVVYKESKLPCIYFKKLVDSISVQALSYVGTTNLVINALSILAKPFYVDEDGEPQAITPAYTPEEITSVEKNPILNFVTNFKCFELKDDEQGSWKDKYELWSSIIVWLGVYAQSDKNIIANNPWIFSNDTYFNDLGVIKKVKAFCKKASELATNKKYFENLLNEC